MYEGQTITTTETLVVIQCYKCQCFFGMPSDLKRRAKEDNSIGFYCPNGHQQFYQKSEYQKIKDELESSNRTREYLERKVVEKIHQIEQLNYSVRAQKAAKTKILNRVKNGVCPCCNRTFANLQNHFKTQHPELLQQ